MFENFELRFILLAKKGQSNVVELMANNHFKNDDINSNAQNVNGMTPFDLARLD